MEFVIGIILVLTFSAGLLLRKGHNLMIGFLIIPFSGLSFLCWALFLHLPSSCPPLQFGGDSGDYAGHCHLNKIYQSAPEGWGTTLVNVCWGAWVRPRPDGDRHCLHPDP